MKTAKLFLSSEKLDAFNQPIQGRIHLMA